MATVDNRKWLYEQLTGLGYNLGSYEDYDQAMNDRTNQDWAYDAAKSRGINMGDRNSYYQAIGLATASDGSVEITEHKEEESRFGILGKMGQYMGSPSAYVPMPQAEEREELTQAEIDQRAAMRQMLQDSGTIDRMEEMEKEARKNKFKAFGEALAYTPQVSSFGVSSNIYKDTEEQLADAQRALEASAEHRQNKAMEQTLDVALDKARAGEWGGIGENNVGNGVVDFGLGLWDSATRMSTWDFGVSDTLNGLTIAQVVKKWEENPDSLTATERNLLDAMGMATAVQEAYADQTGIGYSVGESLPQSAGFMASMYLNPASGMGKALARQAVKKYGRQSIAKNLARIGGDIAETAIMTATTGGGRVVADALDRINGQSTYEIDPETGIVMYGGQEDQKTVGEAVVKAIGSNFIENYSEAIGEYFDPLLGMSRRLAAGGLRKMNLDKWADALSDVQPSQMAASIRSLREKAKFGGVFGEIMEEEVGMALNAITVGDYTFSKEEAEASKGKKQWIFDLENQLTTAFSCAIMSGALTGAETISNVGYRRKMEKSVADAEKTARAAVGDEMIAQIDQASPEGMVDVLRDVYMDQNISLKQKRALAEYATQRVRMQYYNAADAKARRQVNVTQQNALDAYEAGRHAQLPQYYNIDQEYRKSEAAINERENAEEIWDAIRLMNNMDENERQNIMRDFSEEDQQLIRNWRYNAYRWRGAVNHRAEQVEDLVDEYAGQVTPYTRPDGTVTTAILGDNVVYVMNEAENGDALVYTNDGRKIFCKMRDLEHVQQHNAEELIERFRQQTTEVVNQETEKNLSYPSEVLEPAQGVTVETLDGKQWQVAATDGENVEIVGMIFDKKSGQWIPNAGDYRKMTREQFMDWQKAELDRKKANTYEQGDELTFYVDGEPISAEITGIDPDGNYYVHVSNLVDGLDEAVSDVYTAEELRKLTTPSSKVSAKTTENDGTPTDEIKQSVSEEVTNGQIGFVGRVMTSEEANAFIPQMVQMAEPAVELDFTPENWVAEFGEDGMVPTPMGNVKMGENQYFKLSQKKRTAYFGMVKPTLINPDIILEEYDPKDGAERDTKLIFVKTFIKPDGSRTVNFESVTVKKGDLEVSISSHEVDNEQLLKKVQQDKLLHLNEKFSSSELRLTEPQQEGSDLVPSPNSISSNTKISGNVSNVQGNGQENNLNSSNLDAGQNIVAPIVYEQVDADTAWDDIVAKSKGNIEVAQEVANEMLANKKKALASAKKSKPKSGNTVDEILANKEANAMKIAQAEADVKAWEAISSVNARRMEEARAEAEVLADELAKAKAIADGIDKLGAPQSLYEYVLMTLAGGGYKIKWDDKANGTKGFGAHTGLSTKEMQKRLAMVDNTNGYTPEELAHDIVENMSGNFGEVDVMDVTDMVIDIVASNSSRGDMFNSLVHAREEAIRQREADEQQQKDAWYMERYHATEEELAAYNEYLAEFAEIIYGEDSDYEQRIATFAEIQLEYDNQGTDAGLRSSADQGEGLASDREGGRSVGETEQLNQREVLGDAAGVATSEDQGIGGSVSAESDVIETIKSELGVFSADNAAEYAARMFEAYKWKTLEEANESLKQLLASYGQKLDGQTLGVVPFLDAAQDQINAERDWQRYQEDLAEDAAETVETLENGDVRITNRNSNGEIATVAIERDGNVISVDTYEDGALFERTDYDANGNATKVTRYKDGEVVLEQEYKDGKRKVTANVFEMAEEAQKKRKPKKKKDAQQTNQNLQEERKEGAATTGAGKSRPNGTFSISYYTQFLKELFQNAHWEERPSEEVAGIIRRHNAGKTLLARTEDERELLSALRALTNNEIQDELSNINNALQSDEYTDEEKEELKRAKNLITRFVNRGERNAVIEALTGAKLGEKLPLSKIDELFEMYNSDANVAELYGRVRAIAEQIGLDFWFEEMEDRLLGGYLHSDNRVRLNAHMLYCPRMQRQGVASTIVHEILHAVADYAIETQRDVKLGLTPKVQLSKQVLNAANTILNIYEKAVKGNPALVHQEYDIEKEEWIEVADYGTTSVHEMLSEISNPEFRDKLKQIEYNGRSVWQRIWDAIKSMFTQSSDVTNPTAYDSMAKALDVLINEFSVDAYRKYSGLEESASRVYHGSGALFDKFDHSFMGTGEGNQAFGWGTYVSESNGVAKTYAEISARNVLFNSDDNFETVRNTSPSIVAATVVKQEMLRNNTSFTDAKRMAEENFRFTVNDTTEDWDDNTRELAGRLADAAAALTEEDVESTPYGGVVYDVEIPDDNGSNYLEWYEVVDRKNEIRNRLYERLTEGQGEAYKAELKQELYDVFRFSDNSGSAIYKNLSAYLGGDKAASQFLHEMGFVGIKYPTNTLHVGNIDGTNNYVIFDENDLEIMGNLRFRDGAPFYSNAERAVENIKQNKATPEQWLAMIKKDGGLKAGEDKWMGLSDWLNEKNADGVKSLTKDEVLAFIRENQIEIEEVEYESNPQSFEDLKDEYEAMLRDEGYDAAHDAMVDRFGDDFDIAFEDLGGELAIANEEAAATLLGSGNIINSTRLDYTTEGLDNKREIALVVPTIEPWNESDEIHFGDAGEGRAVAWVRFGETTDEDGNRVLVIDEVQSKRHDEGRAKGYFNGSEYDEIESIRKERRELLDKQYSLTSGFTIPLEELPDNIVEEYESINERIRSIERRSTELTANTHGVPDAPFDKNYHELVMKRMLRYAAENGFDKVAWTKGKQQAKRYDLAKHVSSIEYKPLANGHYNVIAYSNLGYPLDGVPMVYDSEQAIADVFGKDIAQQIAQDVEENRRKAAETEQALSELKEKRKELRRRGVDEDSAEFEETLEEFSRLSNELSETQSAKFIEGTDLSTGGEDRNALYDEMIPRFMNKYVKKWDTKVGEVTLPEVEEAGRTMWSVDVTPEMRESVMQGQPMFREGMGAIPDREVSYENDPIAKWLGKPRYYGKRASAFAERERARMQKGVEKVAKILGIEVEIITDASTLKGRKAKAKGWYDINSKKVVVVIPNHVSKGDAVRTVLHEGVAHHGLRELFGDGFDNMLDNVYNNVAPELKARIDAIAERTGVSTSVATEEYLASLAEDTEFEYANKMGWWDKIKHYFVDMLRKLSMPGLNLKEEITDNELRFLLWRSYQNLVDPNRYLKPLGYLDDVAKQKELKVGNYAENTMATPRAAEKQRQLYQKRIDNAYLKAVREGDWEEATDLFRQYVLSKAEDEGIVPMDYGVGYRGGAHSSIAKKVKEENPDAIAEAAYQMSIRIPKGSILVPMPSRTGNATYTVKLAEAIAKATDSEVRDVLKGKARMSVYEAKQKGVKMTPEDLGMYTTEELPKGKNIVIIDNVIDKGTTALAAVSAVKGASVVAYAYTLGDKQRAATLKLAEPVTYDDNMRIIPLSERFNPANNDIRYREDGEMLFSSQELAKMKTPIHKSKGGFRNLSEAEAWSKKYLQGKTRTNQFTGDEISIGKKSVSEMLNEKTLNQSVDVNTHLAALQSVLDFIETGIPAEVHKDTHGRDFDVMRIYNAIEVDGKVYRVKSTVRKVKQGDKYYTYEVQKMELIEERGANPNREGEIPHNGNNSTNSISGAKLLKGVKKTNSNEEILPSDEDIRDEEGVISEVERESANLGVQVRIAHSIDELPDEDTRKRAVDGQLKGYFDPRTGEVVVYEPNTDNANDAKRTVLHEIVGHKGLRQLIGEERYDKAMVQLMYMLPSEVRDAVLRRAERHGWNAAIAMDEYLADQAERDVQPTWWGKVNAKIRALLRNMGFDVKLTDADVTYLLWRSRKKLMGDTAFDMATDAILKQAARKSAEADAWNEQAFKDAEMRDFEKGAMQRLRNRVGDAQNEYDSAMKSTAFKQRESWQDSMRSLKVFMDILEKESGKKIADWENAYMYENAMSSANLMEMQMFRHDVYGRLLKAINELMESGAKYEEVVDYMMAKHGLERNEKMARKRAEKEAEGDEVKEAELYAKYRGEDLSGLTALTGVDNVADAESAAMQMIADFEAKHNTDLLWNETRACTQTILNISHDAGILSDEVYGELWNQYEYYIPLRGFDETTAEEVYTYVGDNKSPYNAAIKTAKGRKSKADDPIATIANMAESAIVEANRNRLKQRFLYMVERHKTELASVSSVWVEKDPVTGDCVARFAKIPNDATPEEAAQAQKAFEERMEQLHEQEPERYYKASEKPNIPYRVEKKANEHEHQVVVKRGGKDVVITINGDPRVAQAINGLTNPEAAKGFDKLAGNVNRFLSANFTTRNPAFVVSNFVRDGFYTNSMVWAKESPAYAWKYNQNWAKATKLLPSLVSKYKRYEKGDKSALDMSDPVERAFYEFMINGGETGYTVINSVEDYKGIVAGDLRAMQGGVVGNTKKAVQAVGNVLDTFGRWAEDTSRFAAFLTSREMGRSVTKSIWDAKEISVNFNKKGSGRKMTQHDKGLNSILGWMSQQGRNLYVFWNAGMQGMFNFGKAVKEHPGKMAGLAGVYFGLGMAIAAIFGGHDDDDEDYWNLPEYVRRNNICFRVGNKFVALPLPIELRAIYGMGELAMSWMAGKEDPKKVGMKVVQQMSQVMPIDMMAEGGGLMAFVPSWAKPIVEVGVNTDWTGMPIYHKRTPWNEYDPQWMLAFKSTSPELVAASRAINEATNKNLPSGKENKYDRGWADIEYLNNPAAWEHIAEGYLGGLATMFNQTKKSAMAIWNEDLREVRNIPVVSRFVKDAGEKSEEYALREDYFNAKKVVDELRSQRGHFRKESTDQSLTEEQRKDVMESRIEMEEMVNATISQWDNLENTRKRLEDMVNDNPDQEVTFDGKKGRAEDALDEVTRRMVKLTEGYQ